MYFAIWEELPAHFVIKPWVIAIPKRITLATGRIEIKNGFWCINERTGNIGRNRTNLFWIKNGSLSFPKIDSVMKVSTLIEYNVVKLDSVLGEIKIFNAGKSSLIGNKVS